MRELGQQAVGTVRSNPPGDSHQEQWHVALRNIDYLSVNSIGQLRRALGVNSIEQLHRALSFNDQRWRATRGAIVEEGLVELIESHRSYSSRRNMVRAIPDVLKKWHRVV